jgi:hypothetical protein
MIRTEIETDDVQGYGAFGIVAPPPAFSLQVFPTPPGGYDHDGGTGLGTDYGDGSVGGGGNPVDDDYFEIGIRSTSAQGAPIESTGR